MRLVFPVVVLAVVTLAAQGPTLPLAPAPSITGIVVDDRGQPIVGAKISVDSGAEMVRSDANGLFTLPVPLALTGSRISKIGYTTSTAVIGPRTDGVRVELARAAVITGRVLDDTGDPLVGFPVLAEQIDDQRQVTTRTTGETNDRGEYRIFSLKAGAYLVSLPNLGRSSTNPYFPGVSGRDNAEPLVLAAGDERSGTDFTVSTDRLGLSFGQNPPVIVQPNAVLTEGTGAVRGVVADTNGRPIRHARVALAPVQPGPTQNQFTFTEGDGRFQFDRVPAARYRIIAGASGYLPGGRDDTLARGTQMFELAEGATNNAIRLSLLRASTLTGQVFDEFGDPVSGARVQLLRLGYEEGRRSLVPTAGSRQTDDSGSYRLFGLFPGDYVLRASIGDAGSDDVPGYAMTYFPGTADPTSARYVAVPRSEDLTGVDISLERAKTVRLAGLMFNAQGQPTMGGGVSLSASWRSAAVTSAAVGARIPRAGIFDFSNVAPGQYVIQAYAGRKNSFTEGEFGAVTVTAGDSDVTDLVLRMTPGSTITGRVIFENAGDGPLPPPSSVSIMPVPSDFDHAPPGAWASASIDRDYSFRLLGISGPRRLEVLSTPRGWGLREVRVDGIDVTDQPIGFGTDAESLSSVEIRLTHQPSLVSGTVTDANAAPASGAPILLFPSDNARWYPRSRYVRMVRSTNDGLFTVEGLPTGVYYAATPGTLPAYGQRAWEDPAFLESLLRDAQLVTVSDGQRTAVNLKRPRR